MKIYSKPVTIAVRYDFAVYGGAVGVINLGDYIPANSTIIVGSAHIITALTSGGAATIAVGYDGAPTALIAATAVASWSLGAVLEGVDLPANQIEIGATPLQLNMTIAVADLLTGVFTYQLMVIQKRM